MSWGTRAQLQDAVRRAAAAAGLQVEQSAPDTLLLTGKVRPYWAVVAAGLLALPTLGLSLFLLRVKTSGAATATESNGPRGRHLRLTGQFPDFLPSVIEHLLAEQQAAAVGPAAVGPPLATFLNGTHPGYDDGAAWTASRVMAPVAAADLVDVDATMSRPRVVDLTGGAPLLVFDDGVSVTLTRFALLGRAPSPASGDPGAQLLPIADPELSVSKTHLALGIDGQGLWVCDRHSTNGSAITYPDGTRTRCEPGKRHYVSSGSTVQVGDRSFSVAFAGIPLGRSH